MEDQEDQEDHRQVSSRETGTEGRTKPGGVKTFPATLLTAATGALSARQQNQDRAGREKTSTWLAVSLARRRVCDSEHRVVPRICLGSGGSHRCQKLSSAALVSAAAQRF